MSLGDLTPSAFAKALARYREPDHTRSLLELALTGLPFLLLFGAAIWAGQYGWWWAALISVPTAFFLVRLFMIQHDCGHGSFFRWQALNDWVGRIIGVATVTPYAYWRHTHAIHHGASGDLDRRGLGAVEMLTVEEYHSKSWLGRLGYRLYRNPVVMFGLGPTYMFLIQHRLPVGMMKAGWRPWVSVIGTNLAILAVTAGMIAAFGVAPVLVAQLTTMILAATIGVWLFYVQHQYEGVSWSRSANWNAMEAALAGSSHYDLPPVLRWLTANIGIHHVHHAASKVPFYRLPEVLRDMPHLRDVGRITLGESFRYANLALWDEAQGRLVSFREARRSRR